MNDKQYVGIGVGASRAKIVIVSSDLAERRVMMKDHYGSPRSVIEELLSGVETADFAGLAATGREGCDLMAGRKVFESEAVEECLALLGIRPDAVVSLGGESFVVYPIGPDGSVLDSLSGNRCAAGTVEFFKQQLGRMSVPLAEVADIAASGKVVPLAKRCSVHCKSDCTHALNRGLCTTADIVRTLCYNMAEKVAGLVRGADINKGRLAIIGGAAANPIIVGHIRELLSGFDVVVPPHAECFEALGAASIARKRSLPMPSDWSGIFRKGGTSFGFLSPLADYGSMVTFLEGRTGRIAPGRKYILGIDGGSTTTKAALVDGDTLEICGSHYTRTNGNPEKAMKECLERLRAQVVEAVGGAGIEIAGVCTTGSSGEILSVLCETPWHHNEIVAHAYGAMHFCPEADTIFEVGGQDAKFTSLRSKTAVDFSMNDACSAGTGSFIEETAMEDLGVPMERIADLAISAPKPPRFSDQCAAFANSDTRKAFQEGAGKDDNLAGLVYAIAENYMNKVVGRRKVGAHILFQGGTSKNKAIAYAFAAKTGKHITVPPHSELIGCFGIALWLREKMAAGDAKERKYSIDRILDAQVGDSREFTCKACENLCAIRNIEINGKKYPFGGRCSRWENARKNKKTHTEELDIVAKRNSMLFREYGAAPRSKTNGGRPVIGMQAVFSVCAFYPLYSWFFRSLGYDIALAGKMDAAGVQKCQSARCYPYEIAHGTFKRLLNEGVRSIFAPHVVGMPSSSGPGSGLACPIAQAAPYYLSSAFKEDGIRIHAPVLDMSSGLEAVESAFLDTALSMGHVERDARSAFRKGCEMQSAFMRAAGEEGSRVLERLEERGDVGIVIIGRPYNAFTGLANMGVPLKFASSGVTVIPCDFLPCEGEYCESTMYWKYGEWILKSARFVKKHPNLFAVYISNFGCGPDSFIQHFTNRIMGEKPYLYLELDSHTADAGVMTRVAAFMDIISGYRKLGDRERQSRRPFVSARVEKHGGRTCVRSSGGELVPLTDRRVTLAFPSMGRYNSEAIAAASRKFGFSGVALPPPDEGIVGIGKAYTSGKECSPAILTVGSLMNYCRNGFKKEMKDEILLYFMPTANGPCRFGQYNVYMKQLMENLEMEDVAFYSLSSADGYRGLGLSFVVASWLAVVSGGLMLDIKSVLKVAAEDKPGAMAVFEDEWRKLLDALSRGYVATWKALRSASRRLGEIRLKADPRDIPRVLLAGEIYVRSDELSCSGIDDCYAAEGIMLKRADIMEWIYATNWVYLDRLAGSEGYPSDFLSPDFFRKMLKRAGLKRDKSAAKFAAVRMTLAFEEWVERSVRRILGRSGLLVTKQHGINDIIRTGAGFLNPALRGEAILTVGSAVEVMEHSPLENYCGVVFIGPFNCMPTGIAESIMKPYARRKGIPYLTVETDGGPMPSNFRSQMEVHILRAKRYAESIRSGRSG